MVEALTQQDGPCQWALSEQTARSISRNASGRPNPTQSADFESNSEWKYD